MRTLNLIISDILKIPHAIPLSYSKINTLLYCPFKYKQQYILKNKGGDIQNLEVLKVGKFIHKVLELCLNKGQSYGWEVESVDFDVTWAQVMNSFRFNKKEYEIAKLLRIPTKNIHTRLVKTIRVNNLIIAPEMLICMDKLGNVKTHIKFKHRFFYGFIDFYAENSIHTRGLLIDFKSHASSKENKRDAKVQLSTYAYHLFLRNPKLISLQYGEAYIENEVINLTSQIYKDSEEFVQLQTIVFKQYEEFINIINQNKFFPKISKYCAWCPYILQCPAYK